MDILNRIKYFNSYVANIRFTAAKMVQIVTKTLHYNAFYRVTESQADTLQNNLGIT